MGLHDVLRVLAAFHLALNSSRPEGSALLARDASLLQPVADCYLVHLPQFLGEASSAGDSVSWAKVALLATETLADMLFQDAFPQSYCGQVSSAVHAYAVACERLHALGELSGLLQLRSFPMHQAPALGWAASLPITI